MTMIGALKPRPKPSDNQSEEVDDTSEPMEIENESAKRTLRKRKEKVPKHLKREANPQELENFKKRVLKIPTDRPFEEVYFTHMLWMFFRETRVTDADIEKMFNQVRDELKNKVTLKKKSDPGEFIIPCRIKSIEFTRALCDTGASASIIPKFIADHLGLKIESTKEFFCFVDCSRKSSLGITKDLEVQIGNALVPVDFHVLDIKFYWNSSLLLGRGFLATVGAVCDLQTNKMCLTLIKQKIYYDPVKIVKQHKSCNQPPDEAKLVADCYCEVEYETEY
ncbi:uncharacterized protein LOC108815753 [Raphanus sativus]|uniref:Uncharacterized protein LOC108815753 n=1 Tax=Raphanus sativus TaxID=3726 RepID=A0A6J0K6Z5_RAPSA|nr:uncharacterized protein LOC108815753 [Raphanus sativus]